MKITFTSMFSGSITSGSDISIAEFISELFLNAGGRRGGKTTSEL